MVLIISEKKDRSTIDVINWLDSKKKAWFLINGEDEIKINYKKNDLIFWSKETNKSIMLSEVTSVWYRRGKIKENFRNNFENVANELIEFLKIEHKFIKEYVYYLLSKKRHLNTFSTSIANKLIVLDEAKECGLLVPESYIIDSKEEFDLIKENKALITKTISGEPSIKIEGRKGVMLTNAVNEVTEKRFFPSLFQEQIQKKYELRVFFLDGKTYSMAIFSQQSSETLVDFRNHYGNIKNRTVPFYLPEQLKPKIQLLMDKLQLNSGSLDFLVTNKNEYYFLEVNPVGQFGMVSIPCNYRLEEKIANYLTQ